MTDSRGLHGAARSLTVKRVRVKAWGTCPECGRERPCTKRYGMYEHNRYDRRQKAMVPCAGFWQPAKEHAPK